MVEIEEEQRDGERDKEQREIVKERWGEGERTLDH